MKSHKGLFLLFLFLLISSQARAEDSGVALLQNNMNELQAAVRSLQNTMADLQSTVASQNEVIRQQAVQIDALQKGGSAAGAQSQANAGGVLGAASKAVGNFNPDISVAATTQAKLTQNKADQDGNNSISLKELELNFSQAVDPFSRLDAIISFNDNLEAQNVDIEEAYYTRWGLPLGFTAQAGKFRADIGKENLLHAHQLETADYPLVIRNFFGDEGLASSGLRLQNNIPNPLDIPMEITGEILRGNNGNSFSGISRRPIFNTHLKTFFELAEDSNLELGWTTLFGDENPPRTILADDGTGTLVESSYAPPQGQDRYGVKVYGADATLNWFLPEGKKVQWQNEIYFQNRTDLVHPNGNPWGFYSLLDYKFSSKFSTGIRFDYLNPLDVTGSDGTTGVSPYFVFWQSEFADAKLQYSHTTMQGDTKTDNAVYVVVDCLIGSHKHPIR